MRARSLLAAAAALTVSASTASAAFHINRTRTAGTGDLAGFDIVRFFGQLGPEEVAAGAVGLQSANVTLVAMGAGHTLKISFTVLNNHPNFTTPNDADIYGAALTDDLCAPRRMTATREWELRSGFATRMEMCGGCRGCLSARKRDHPNDPLAAYTSLPINRYLSSVSNNPQQRFVNLKSLRVEGFVQNPSPPGVGADPKAGTDPLGALFAIAVVPTGGTVRGFGAPFTRPRLADPL